MSTVFLLFSEFFFLVFSSFFKKADSTKLFSGCHIVAKSSAVAMVSF